MANPVYSSEEESRIRPNGRPGSRKASRRYGSEEESRIKKKRRANKSASPKSDELKLKCYAIRIALLSEYIRANLLMAITKQEIVNAWSQHGWSFTIRNPIGNFETIMDDDVFDTEVRKIPRLKRAHTLLTNLQNLVRHKTSWLGFDLEVALRPTRNEDCEELQQLYNKDCINVDLRKIYDSSDSDTDDEQHASVMNCGGIVVRCGKQRTRPPVR